MLTLLTSAPDMTRHRRLAQKEERRDVLKRKIDAEPLFAWQGKCRERIASRRAYHATETRAQTPRRGGDLNRANA